MTFEKTYDLNDNNQLIIKLPERFRSKKRVRVIIEDIDNDYNDKIESLQRAVNGPLFLSDIQEVQDDFQYVAKKLTDADRVVIATPVFFMGPSAQAKAMIDRCQSFWARKYVLKAPLKEEPLEMERRGAWVSVGGTRGTRLFDGIELTMRYFFDAIYIASYTRVEARRVDAKGEILRREDALSDAYEKGIELAQP